MKLKHVLCSFIFLASLNLFSSCSNENKEIVSSYYHENISSFIYVDNNELIELSNNKQDFILFIFSDCGCGGNTDSVISTFNQFIQEEKLIIYAISSTDYKKLPTRLSDNFPLYPSDALKEADTIPLLYFYNDGKLFKKQKYTNEFKSTEGIKEIIYKYTQINGLYYINNITPFTYDNDYDFFKFNEVDLSLLNNKIEESATIYYSWKKCSDCLSFKNIFEEFYEKSTRKIFLFEVDHFRNSINKELLWDDEEKGFPYIYDFASYRKGKVPTIVNYKNGIKEDMFVYHNDVVTNSIVTESFHQELIGNSYSEEELEKIHKEKALIYLNKENQ